MKRIKFFLLLATLFLFGLAANVNATTFNSLFSEEGTINRDKEDYGTFDPDFYGYYSNDWSGYYLGTFEGNPSETDLRVLAEFYLGFVFEEAKYAKVEEPGTKSGFLTVTYTKFKDDTNEPIGGGWSLDDPYEIGFYSVKGGPEFAFYYVDPFQSSGTWSTTHLLVGNDNNFPAISHLSVLATEGVPVPEPGLLLLLGSGLIGLAAYGRRKING